MKFLIGEKLFREVKVDRATVQEDGRTVELLFSSEEPVEKFFGTEILDQGPESVRPIPFPVHYPLLKHPRFLVRTLT